MSAEEEGANYAELFRQMIVRGAEAALASVDPAAPKLEEDVRERSLYVLSLALDWPDAWPVTRDLVLSLTTLLRWQGYREEWIAYLTKATAGAQAQGDTAALATLYQQISWLCRLMSEWDQARDYAQRAYELSVAVASTDTRIDALDQLSGVAVELADFEAARKYIDEVFALIDAGDPRRASSCGRLGYMAMHHGDYDAAVSWYSEGIRLNVAAGKYVLAGQGEEAIGVVYEFSRQLDKALVHLQRAIEIFNQFPSPVDLAQTQMEMGLVHARLHNFQQALTLFQQCEPVFVNTNSKLWLAHLYNNYGLVYTEMGRFEDAQHCFTEGIQAARRLEMPQWIANVLESYGMMFARMGRVDDAVAIWKQALAELAVLSEPPRHLHDLLVKRIAEVSNREGNPASDSPP